MQTNIYQLQSETLLHLYQNKFGLKLVIILQIFNGAQMKEIDKFYKMEELQLSFIH